MPEARRPAARRLRDDANRCHRAHPPVQGRHRPAHHRAVPPPRRGRARRRAGVVGGAVPRLPLPRAAAGAGRPARAAGLPPDEPGAELAAARRLGAHRTPARARGRSRRTGPRDTDAGTVRTPCSSPRCGALPGVPGSLRCPTTCCRTRAARSTGRSSGCCSPRSTGCWCTPTRRPRSREGSQTPRSRRQRCRRRCRSPRPPVPPVRSRRRTAAAPALLRPGPSLQGRRRPARGAGQGARRLVDDRRGDLGRARAAAADCR